MVWSQVCFALFCSVGTNQGTVADRTLNRFHGNGLDKDDDFIRAIREVVATEVAKVAKVAVDVQKELTVTKRELTRTQEQLIQTQKDFAQLKEFIRREENAPQGYVLSGYIF